MSSDQSNDANEQKLSRREFLKIGLGTLAAAALLEAGIGSFLYFRSRATAGEFGGVISAGSLESFPAGSVTEFGESHFYLIRAEDGGFLALYRRCPHLGCIVNWEPEDDGFYCPCHASNFDRYGDFKRPPVPRALDTFAVHYSDGQVMVDTTHVQRRNRFHPAQLSYVEANT